jgi:predicted ribosomally synthesized peptide with SipW-like signal peptide
MKKKIILLCTAAAMVAVLAVGATLAYLTDTDQATNTLAIGTVKGTLTENGPGNDPDWDGGDDDEKGIPILPNQWVVKEPKVTLDTNSSDAYVRLKVEGVDFSDDGDNPAVYFLPYMWDATEETGTVGYNEDDWTMVIEDGIYYFYYNSVLSNDDALTKATTPLFSGVKLKSNIDNLSADPVIENIIVYAELIQADYLENDATTAQKAFELYEQEGVIDVNKEEE